MRIDSFNPNELTINRTLVGSTIDIVATASEVDAFTAVRALSTDDWDVEPIMLLDTDFGKYQLRYQSVTSSNFCFCISAFS